MLAHPGFLKKSLPKLELFIAQLKKAGLEWDRMLLQQTHSQTGRRISKTCRTVRFEDFLRFRLPRRAGKA